MALYEATLAQLQTALQQTIERAERDRPTTGQLFQLMYNTGLRVREVLEVERWSVVSPDTFRVQLEKKEGTRDIATSAVPAPLLSRYTDHQPFVMETYSAVNNTFKYHGIGMLFGSDTRRTTCHAFRYQFVKQLSEDGLTISQIADVIGHVNLANTARYVTDTIWLGS